jgi:hypothetical protein
LLCLPDQGQAKVGADAGADTVEEEQASGTWLLARINGGLAINSCGLTQVAHKGKFPPGIGEDFFTFDVGQSRE